MTQTESPGQAAQRVHQALDLMERDTPALGEIIAAFRPLKAAQAEFQAGLPALDSPLPRIDGKRLAQGEPLAGTADFLVVQGLNLADYLRQAATKLLPALAAGFPALALGLDSLDAALAEDDYGPSALKALLTGREDELGNFAERAGLSAASLEFTLLELSRPLLEKRALALGSLLQGHEWRQGSCPVCGGLPILSYLEGSGGRRWLRCSLCAHHWPFKRTACPVCGNENQELMEFFFAQGRERERVEACYQCSKYVLSLDVRGLDQPPVWEVAALGLVHLDLLAQQKGLAPAARTAWNQVE